MKHVDVVEIAESLERIATALERHNDLIVLRDSPGDDIDEIVLIPPTDEEKIEKHRETFRRLNLLLEGIGNATPTHMTR